MRRYRDFRGGWLQIFSFILVLSICTSCEKGQELIVEEIIPIPESGRINKIVFFNVGEGYILGGSRWEHGFLYRTTDEGMSWHEVNSVGDTSDFWLTDLAAISENERICTGYGGQIFHSSDQGEEWTFLRSLPYEAFETAMPLPEGMYLLGGSGQSNMHITQSNAGQWWNLKRDTFPIFVLASHISITGEQILSGHGAVYVRAPESEEWLQTRLSGDIFTDIDFPAEDVGYICGFNGSIWRINKAVDDPVNLIPTSPLFGAFRSWSDIHFFDTMHGAVVGAMGDIWWTHDGGSTWIEGITPSDQAITSIHMISAHQAWIGGDSGYLAKVRLP